MIFLTGDTHRHFERVEDFCLTYETESSDVLIILGDAGINYHGEKSDYALKRELSELPITLFCIHGNHEMRPESINTYQEAEMFGGIVFTEPEFPNLIFARDGEIYELDGRQCIVIGGAYSIDKYSRTPGRDWWPDEQPDDFTKARVEQQLEAVNWNIDVVLTHTCPYKYLPREEFMPGIRQSTVDNSTEEWLDVIEDKLTYSSWYCGHFHTDKIVGNIIFLQDDVLELYEG